MEPKQEPEEVDLHANTLYECPFCGHRMWINQRFKPEDAIQCHRCDKPVLVKNWVRVKKEDETHGEQ